MKFKSLLILNLLSFGSKVNSQQTAPTSKQSDVLQNFFEDTKVFFDNLNSSLFGVKTNTNSDRALSASSNSLVEGDTKQFNLISINEDEAKKWLRYSALAYCPEDKVLNWTCPDCLKDRNNTRIERYFIQNPKFENSGYVLADSSQKIIVVGFKGTKTTINWAMNLKTDYYDPDLPAPFSDAKIHSGFYEMCKVLYPDMKKHFVKLIKKHPTYKIIMTGHSMGGALATLSAFSLVRDNVINWEKLSVITYGQPRVGNQEFADYLNSQHTVMTRVNREGDLVPTVPTPPLYYHHGHNFYIHFDNTVKNCLPSDLSWDCSTSPINMMFDYHFSFWDKKLDSKCGVKDEGE
jgi:hypothetical protein